MTGRFLFRRLIWFRIESWRRRPSRLCFGLSMLRESAKLLLRCRVCRRRGASALVEIDWCRLASGGDVFAFAAERNRDESLEAAFSFQANTRGENAGTLPHALPQRARDDLFGPCPSPIDAAVAIQIDTDSSAR